MRHDRRLNRFVASLLSLWIAFAPLVARSDSVSPKIDFDIGSDIVRPVHAGHGMVASDQSLATAVGVEVLKRGGNAVDAAVAVGFALAVVLPYAGNIGGGGFMLIHDARSGHSVALDFREMAPGRAARDMYLNDKGEVIAGRSLYTHQAVAVPGTVAGLVHALKKYGTWKLADVIAPAVRLARDGFVVSDELAQRLYAEREHLEKWDASRAIFFKQGRPLQAGERLIQRDLAASLQLIARQGPNAFYQGPIARQLAAEMTRHGGLLALDDLGKYRVVEREPVVGSYRGYKIVSMPPPSSGGTHIIQILQILERYPLKDFGAASAQTIHLMSEVMKPVYASRSEYMADPDFVNVPVKALLSRAYIDELAKGINFARATPSADIKPLNPQPYESEQTTHYSVVDGRGNAVSTTYTLNTPFGSGIVAAGTGILLNNEMDDFSAKAGVPNAFGLTGGAANAIAAHKRPLSSMSPTMVLKDGKPWLVTGSPGGSRIITTVMQTIVNVIDFGMNPAEAAHATRVHHQWNPDELRIERGLSPDTLRLLEQKGHKIVVGHTMGRTQTVQITGGGFYGYSDPRNPDGATAGY